MEPLKLYKLQKYDIFTVRGKKAKIPHCCKLIKTSKLVKWYNPISWFIKYYTYEYLGEKQ